MRYAVKGGLVAAGYDQVPSGTAFDPSPQFWVYEVERLSPVTVTGRCWFGPITVGMVFDAAADPGGSGSRNLCPCQLRVEEIGAYGHLFNELDQMVSARLILRGTAPWGLGREWILVSREVAADRLAKLEDKQGGHHDQ